jgi:K+-sensing histidine kinase KdpD
LLVHAFSLPSSEGPYRASSAYDSDIRVVTVSSHRVASVAVGLLPVGIAAAWIPLRTDLPNTDVALLLVLGVGAVSILGGRLASAVGALAGAAAFDIFDTPPYG